MIFMLLALIAFTLILQRQSLENSLQGVRYERHLSHILVAPNESMEMITTIRTQPNWFLSFLRVVEYLPRETQLDKAVNSKMQRANILLSYTVYLLPRSKLVRQISFSLPQRGRYTFSGAELGGGDFLGLNERRERIDTFCEVVVYPREIASDDFEETFGGFLGDFSVRRFLIEDPVLTVGFREYTGREPLKAISWHQSARQSRMMVKNYDYTTEPSLTVLLNVECYSEDKDPLLEDCFSITHTVCRILEERGVKYDFYTNATTAGAFDAWNYVGEGLGERHFLTILEGLGRASYQQTEPFAMTLSRVEKGQGHRGLVVITPLRSDVSELDRLLQSGEWWATILAPPQLAL